jgi:hypothetical protein
VVLDFYIFTSCRRLASIFKATATKESSMDGYGSEIVLVSALAEAPQGPVANRVTPVSTSAIEAL